MDLQGSDKFEYDRNFQRLILATMVQRPGLLLAHRGILRSAFFDDPLQEAIAEGIIGFFDDFGNAPTKDSLQELARRGGQQANVALPVVKQLVDSLYEPHPDLDFVAAEVLTFCRVTAVKHAGIKSIGHLQNRDVDAVVRLYENAFLVGRYMKDGLGMDVLGTTSEYQDDVSQFTLPLCIPALDWRLQGGLGPKELGVLMGASGAGKSMGLLHFARAAVMWGKKVVYYTLELSKEVVYARFDSAFSGVPFQELSQSSAKVASVKRRLHEWYGNSLFVKEFPTKQGTVADIKAHLDMIAAELWKPDLICVDYADLLAASQKRDQLWAEMTGVYEDLRGLAMERGLAVWTASQITRDAFDREVVRQQHVSDTLGKVRTADIVITIANPPDLKAKHVLRLSLEKARRAGTGLTVDITEDFSRCAFCVVTPESLTKV